MSNQNTKKLRQCAECGCRWKDTDTTCPECGIEFEVVRSGNKSRSKLKLTSSRSRPFPLKVIGIGVIGSGLLAYQFTHNAFYGHNGVGVAFSGNERIGFAIAACICASFGSFVLLLAIRQRMR